MRYFTSDLHFFDEGIIVFAGRPYANAREMNGDLIARFLGRTRPGDEIYIVGDILGGRPPADAAGATREVVSRLGEGGRTLRLVRGNHDLLSDDEYIAMGFASSARRAEIELRAPGRAMRAVLTHDPCMIQPRGTLGICGHIHTLFDEIWNEERGSLAVNVSVEVRNYEPVSEDEIIAIAARHGYAPPCGDHANV